jgi:hypothetical protein
MKKLQLFIIIFSVVLVSYNCVPDFMIKADVNSYYVDFDSNRQSVLTMSEQDAQNKSSISSKHFGPLYISGNDKVAEFQLEADIPEKSDVFNYEVMLTSSDFKRTPIFAAHSPATGLLHFPSEAYRLRI